jgi:hypothetical protein
LFIISPPGVHLLEMVFNCRVFFVGDAYRTPGEVIKGP